MIDIALSIGFVLGGPAVAAFGPRVVYALGGACGLIGAVVLVPVLRASDARRGPNVRSSLSPRSTTSRPARSSPPG
jgi:hypothetical protein